MKIEIAETDAQKILSVLKHHKRNYMCLETDRLIVLISEQVKEKQNRKKRSF